MHQLWSRTRVSDNPRLPCNELLGSSDEGLDVVLADGVVGEGVSPVSVLEGNKERAEVVVEEATEAHPEGVEVVTDDPGASKEA